MTYMGGSKLGKHCRRAASKSLVVGVAEDRSQVNGRVRAQRIPNSKGAPVAAFVVANIAHGAAKIEGLERHEAMEKENYRHPPRIRQPQHSAWLNPPRGFFQDQRDSLREALRRPWTVPHYYRVCFVIGKDSTNNGARLSPPTQGAGKIGGSLTFASSLSQLIVITWASWRTL